MDTPPAHFRHPRMGRFTRTEENDYVRTVRTAGRNVRLVLNVGYQGPNRVADLLHASASRAARIYDRLGQLVAAAHRLAAHCCLGTANENREFEGKPPLTRDGFAKRLKLLDVMVSRDDMTVAFTTDAYDDEHRLFWVRIGPRGRLRDVEIP